MNNLYLFVLLFAFSSIEALGQEGKIEKTELARTSNYLVYKQFKTEGYLHVPIEARHKIFRIHCGTGTLQLKPSESKEIKARFEIHSFSISRKVARKYIERFSKISLTDKGDELFLRSFFDISTRKKHPERDTYVESPSFSGFLGTPSAKINLVVEVPAGLSLLVQDRSGSIKIENIENNLTLSDNSGRIEMKGVTGDVKIKDGSGHISAKAIQGDLDITDKSGSLLVRDVSGNLKVRDHSGGMTLENIGGNLDVRDKSGHIYIKNVAKEVTLVDASGKIHLIDIGQESAQPYSVEVDDHSGHIYLKNVEADLSLKDRGGRIIHQ